MENPAAKACLLWVTVPDQDCAQTLAEEVLHRGLAACVNIIPGMQSLYRWQGAIHCDQEVVLVVKTTTAAAAACRVRIVDAHPYELPCVLQLAVSDGHGPFVEWLHEQSTDQHNGDEQQ